jgi:hypothetical protein
MGVSYQQTCKFGPCFICADTGIVVGNGSAAHGGAAPRRGIEMDAGLVGPKFRKCGNADCFNLFVVLDRGNRSRCDEHRRTPHSGRAA